MSLKRSYCFVSPLTETSQRYCSSERDHRGEPDQKQQKRNSHTCCLVLFFSGCFGSKRYKDEGWSHDYSTALLVNVFTVCSFYHYYFLQHYYYDDYHDGYTECTVCMCMCVSVFSAQSWSSQRRSWEESIAWGSCLGLANLHPVQIPRLPPFQRSPWSH